MRAGLLVSECSECSWVLWEVPWHPFLPCESFCKESLDIPEDALIAARAVVPHAQQTWLLQPQEHLQSSLQPSRGSSSPDRQKQIQDQPCRCLPQAPPQSSPMAIGPGVKHLQGFQPTDAQKLFYCHVSRVEGGLASEGAEVPSSCSWLIALPLRCHELVNSRKK